MKSRPMICVKALFFAAIVVLPCSPQLVAQTLEATTTPSTSDATKAASATDKYVDPTQAQQQPIPPSSTQPAIALPGNFFQRLGNFYLQDWKGSATTTAAPARRALPAPLDSPPYPSADWGYGGSPLIGTPDANVYPLMTALKLQNSRTKVY